jgi:hypothetical protein
MPTVTPTHVRNILDAYEKAGLLFRWLANGQPMDSHKHANSDKKTWGFWVKIDLPGRLPPRSRVGDDKRHEKVGPEPPPDLLSKYIENHVDVSGEPMASQPEANGCLGLGLGLGKGKKHAARKTEPSLNGLCKEYAKSSFTEKFSQSPAWDTKHFVCLSKLLSSKSDMTLEEFKSRWNLYLSTDDVFHKKQGGSLAYFCSQFDKFIPQGQLNGRTKQLSDDDIEALEYLKRNNPEHSEDS